MGAGGPRRPCLRLLALALLVLARPAPARALQERERECSLQLCGAAATATGSAPGGAAAARVPLTCEGLQLLVGPLVDLRLAPAGEGARDCAGVPSPEPMPEVSAACFDAVAAVLAAECDQATSCTPNLAKPLANQCSQDLLRPLNRSGSDTALELVVEASCATEFDVFQFASIGSLVLTGVGLGASIRPEAARAVFKAHRRGFLVGYACQFVIMPIFALVLSKIVQVNPPTALGMAVLGAAPGGTSSNLLTYFAHGNVALSIAMSIASLLMSLWTMPLWMFILTKIGMSSATVTIPFSNIGISVSLATFPPLIGFALARLNHTIGRAVELFGAFTGLVFLVIVFAIGVRDNTELLDPTRYPKTWIAACFFQPIGGLIGYIIAKRVAKLGNPEARAVALETGIQNLTLTIALVSSSFQGCERTIMLTFPLIAGLFFAINSFWMTVLGRYLARMDTVAEKESRRRFGGRHGLAEKDQVTHGIDTGDAGNRNGDGDTSANAGAGGSSGGVHFPSSARHVEVEMPERSPGDNSSDEDSPAAAKHATPANGFAPSQGVSFSRLAQPVTATAGSANDTTALPQAYDVPSQTAQNTNNVLALEKNEAHAEESFTLSLAGFGDEKPNSTAPFSTISLNSQDSEGAGSELSSELLEDESEGKADAEAEAPVAPPPAPALLFDGGDRMPPSTVMSSTGSPRTGTNAHASSDLSPIQASPTTSEQQEAERTASELSEFGTSSSLAPVETEAGINGTDSVSSETSTAPPSDHVASSGDDMGGARTASRT